jgi:hypothetical protein
MTLVHLKPAQKLNVEETSMYIILDGKVRIGNEEIYKMEINSA